jgi:hypothetical protein
MKGASVILICPFVHRSCELNCVFLLRSIIDYRCNIKTHEKLASIEAKSMALNTHFESVVQKKKKKQIVLAVKQTIYPEDKIEDTVFKSEV